MNMAKIPKFPRKMEELLGLEGKDQFIDFLNDSFHNQEDSVLQVVSDRFDLRVTEEIGKVNQSISLLDKRVTEEISGLRIEMHDGMFRLDNKITEEISGLRMEMHDGMFRLDNKITEEISRLDNKITEEISGLDKRITVENSSIKVQIADLRSELKSDISGIHHAISLQTKWLLTVILAASALISVIQPVMMKLLKMG
jgi:hypothetical protein